MDTFYAYDRLNHLTQVSMTRRTLVSPPTYTTQTRTFVYDTATQRLTSATNPETGTVSYVYNGDGTLNYSTDARGQRTQYAYDLFGRVTQVDRYRADGTQDSCQSATYHYDASEIRQDGHAKGRLASVHWGNANGSCPGGFEFADQYNYTDSGLVTHKRLRLASATAAGYLDVYYNYDAEGRPADYTLMTPTWNSQIDTVLASYGYTRDALGRPTGMTRSIGSYPPTQTVVSNVQWGPGNELRQMDYGDGLVYHETRAYNARLQLTNATTTQSGTPLASFTYSYPAAPANAGRVSQMTDSLAGLTDETVSYQYDSLNRLSQATGSGWSYAYAYDGFGNRTQQGASNWTYNAQTNRLNGTGWLYDANGNLTQDPLSTQYTYDIANRLATAGAESYVYDSQNRRICKNGCQALTFYGAGGEALGTFQPQISYGIIYFLRGSETLHFAGKTIESGSCWVVADRLGSVRADSAGGRFRYRPYGEEYTTTAQDRAKFATYYRDSTGIDYAKQRYYASTTGRFLTPDPYRSSGGPADPQSWNRYTYVLGDPVNFRDRRGLFSEGGCEGCDYQDSNPGFSDDCGPGWVSDPSLSGPCVSGGSGSGGGGGFMPIPSQQSRQDRRANQIEACITGAGLLPSACVPLLAAAAASATPREDKESDCESDVTTASLDSYLSRTPLAGNGYVLLGFGRDYNVDPRFVVALAGAETGFGRNITWGSNNAWNWGWNSGNPKNSPFISLAYGIQVVTSGARRLYLNQGRTTTASFYSKYCVGPDCANGLNNINNFMAQQGGNANDLTFPCRKE